MVQSNFSRCREFEADCTSVIIFNPVPTKSGKQHSYGAVFPSDAQGKKIYSQSLGGIQTMKRGRSFYITTGVQNYDDTGELVTTKNYSSDQTLNHKSHL